MRAVAAILTRRVSYLTAAVCLAVLLAACGEGLSLVAVDSEATPLPFKTPRVAENSVGEEADTGETATADSGSEGQPAISTDEDEPPAVEDASVGAENPTATPEPEPEVTSTTTDPLAEANAEPTTDEDIEAWFVGMIENPAARNIALRAHEVSTDLLVVNETAGVFTYYESELIQLAFDLNVRSFYGTFAFTALPPGSSHQSESPLLFFEQIMVHETSEDADRFLDVFQFEVVALFREEGARMMSEAMPGVFEAGGAPSTNEVPAPAIADRVVFLEVEWPLNASASDLTPLMHIALLRQGNVTAAIALGSSSEAQVYRFFGLVERLISRMS